MEWLHNEFAKASIIFLCWWNCVCIHCVHYCCIFHFTLDFMFARIVYFYIEFFQTTLKQCSCSLQNTHKHIYAERRHHRSYTIWRQNLKRKQQQQRYSSNRKTTTKIGCGGKVWSTIKKIKSIKKENRFSIERPESYKEIEEKENPTNFDFTIFWWEKFHNWIVRWNMSSSCCGTKKQRMNNHSCNHAQSSSNHAKMNGHASSSTPNNIGNHNHATNHNGVCSNGYGDVEQVANAEMCFFCFEVLHRELYRVDDQPEANFTNEA